MAVMYRYLICALFASLISAQSTTTNTTDLLGGVLSTVSSVVDSVTSVIASATSVIDSVTSELATETSAAAVSSLTSVLSSAASVSSSAASVSSSASSVSQSAVSSITSDSSVESILVQSTSTSSASSTTPATLTTTTSSTVVVTSTSSSSSIVTTSLSSSSSAAVTTSSVVTSTETSSTATTTSVTTTTTPPPSTTTTTPSSTVTSSSAVTSTSTSSSTIVVTTSSSIVSVSSSSTTSSPRSSSSSSEGERSSSERSSESSESSTPTFVYTSSSASISYQETVYSTNAVIVTTQPDGSTESRTELTVVQTVVPAATVYATTVVTSTESPTGIAGLQAEGLSSNGSGLSTGAKAGIGAGVGVLVVAAAVIGVLYAMRRRRITRIGDEDRYSNSYGPSMIGGFGIGKTRSRYSESEMNAQQMREANPLDRYTTGVSTSQRTSLPNQSRTGATSDISSVSGVGSEQYRPGPGMPVVVEQPTRAYTPMTGVSELPNTEDQHAHHGYAAAATGNPFVHDDGQTSLYSDDGHQPIQPRTTSPAALELSGENTMNRQPSAGSGGGPGGGQGYRGMDPEQPYHTRQLQKPPSRPGHINPSQNF